jgi:hypothetical protein
MEEASLSVPFPNVPYRKTASPELRVSSSRVDKLAQLFCAAPVPMSRWHSRMPRIASGISEGLEDPVLVVVFTIFNFIGATKLAVVTRVRGALAQGTQRTVQFGGADENLDYQEVVHVFIRGQDPSGRAVHQARQAGAGDIRQLGYPTKNALKGWWREYEQRRDLTKGYTRPKPKYSQEQKDAAVRHYLDHGHCIAATMKSLGYPGRASLTAWVHELNPGLAMRVVGSAQRTPRPQR